MAVKKSSNAVSHKGERTKEDPLSTEIQRQCERKMMPYMFPTFSIDFAAQDFYTALACHKSPHQPPSLFMKSPFTLRCYTLSSNLIPFSCLSRHGIWPWGSEDLKKNLEKENPIICHSVEEDEENKKSKLFFFCYCCSCALKKLNQSRKGCQNMRQNQRRRQNQKRK